MVGRPSNTFVQAQTFADRLVSGDWNTMGWTNAYKPQFKSNLSQDVLGMLGLNTAPNTMTQLQFQQLSSESLHARVSNYMGFIAPAFTGRVENLTNDIFGHSERFSRFGDSTTGVMGSGVSFGAARHIARQIQTLSISDPRMSGNDYNTVVSTGMRMGQFDNARGPDDFVQRAKDMAKAVGDLTRVLHMSTEEVSKSMGALRMNGITDVADQRRTMMQIGAIAQVGGLTTGEAMNAWSRGASIGQGVGISAQVGGMTNAMNLAQVRGMTRNIIPGYIAAIGGGSEAIAENVSQAQMGFASSSLGRAALLGGAGQGQDFLAATVRGMGKAVGGGPLSYAGFERDAMTQMNDLQKNPDAMNALMKGMIDKQLNGMGVTNLTSKQAMDSAYLLYKKYGMNDVAAYEESERNFSEKGIRTSERTRFNVIAATQSQESQLDYDNWSMRNTFMGRFRMATKQLGEFPAQLSNSLQDMGESLVNKLPGASTIGQSIRAVDMGVTPDTISRDALIRAMMSPGAGGSPATAALEYSRPGGAAYWGGWTGWGVGGFGGAKAGAALGGAFGSLFGGVGAIPGAAIGGVLGFMGGSWLGEQAGTAAGALYGADSSGKITGEMASSLVKAQAGSSTLLSREQLQTNLTKLKNSHAYKYAKDALRGKSGQLADDTTSEVVNYIRNASRATGVSEDQVTASLNSEGFNVNFADTVKSMDFSDEAVAKKYESALGKLGLSDSKNSKLATREGAAALEGYLSSIGKDDEGLKARDLRAIGMSAEEIQSLKAKVQGGGGSSYTASAYAGMGGLGMPSYKTSDTGMSGADKESLIATIGGRRSSLEKRAGNRALNQMNFVAESLISDSVLKEKLHNNKGDLYDIIRGGDKNTLAELQNVFGTAEKIAATEIGQFSKENAAKTAAKFGIRAEDFKTIENEISKLPEDSQAETMRRTMTNVAAMGTPGLEEQVKREKESKETAMLVNASKAMENVCTRLGV